MSSDIPKASIVEDPGADGAALLASALEQSGFWPVLDAAGRRAAAAGRAMHILIKPDLEAFDAGSPAATDVALVETMIDLLHERGHDRVDLCGTADSSFLWAENRDVAVLAELLGYRYVTTGGHPYDVLDLSEDLAPASFPAGGVLSGSELARAWQQSTFRICVARNKTDEREGYALCLNGLLGVLPLADKDYYYRQRLSAGDAVCELLRATPVDFAIVDATVSAHGRGGGRAPKALRTDCIIAARDPVLADFAGALKMGLDPYVSPLAATAYRTVGLPERYRIEGNLGTYPGWRNVEPVVIDSYRQRDRLPEAGRLLTPWLQTLNPELFPLKHLVDAKLNPRLSRFFAEESKDSPAWWLLVLANYAIGAAGHWLETYRVLYDKDATRRIEVPLGFDPDAIDGNDYAAIRGELDQLEALLAGSATTAEGLRWREVDGATLFEFERELPIPFDHFVAAVDVARTIQFMNDYIGGTLVPIEHDARGRVVRQAERNLYLPQPNYLALYQGKPIDVAKVEICDYADDRHRMYWKTIKSENQSATHDDGVVIFRRTGRGTLVRIFGRQLFTLPPFWQAVDLNLAPQIKSALVTHAYRTFFERTCANFEALVEGRDIRIGRPWHVPVGPFDAPPLPARRLEELASHLGDRVQELVEAGAASDAAPLAPRAGGPRPTHVDEDGFRHFEAAQDTTGGVSSPAGAALMRVAEAFGDYLSGLSDAIARDIDRAGRGAGAAPR